MLSLESGIYLSKIKRKEIDFFLLFFPFLLSVLNCIHSQFLCFTRIRCIIFIENNKQTLHILHKRIIDDEQKLNHTLTKLFSQFIVTWLQIGRIRNPKSQSIIKLQAPKKNGVPTSLKSRSSSVPASQRKAFAAPKPSSGGGQAGAVDADSFMHAFEDVKKVCVCEIFILHYWKWKFLVGPFKRTIK